MAKRSNNQEKNDGKEFEKLAEQVFKLLYADNKNAKIERDVMVEGTDGARQVDVLITLPIADHEFKLVIECRDFNKKLSVTHIDGFASKLSDIRVNAGMLVSKRGFSSMAIAKAKRHNITLYNLNDNVTVDIKSLGIKFMIRQISLISFKTHFGDLEQSLRDAMEIYLDSNFLINEMPFKDVMKNIWANEYLDISKEQVESFYVDYKLSNPPYIIKQPYNGQFLTFTLQELFFELTIRSDYFLGDFESIKNAQVLHNETKNQINTFFEFGKLKDHITSAKSVPPTIAEDYNGFIYIFRHKCGSLISFEKSFKT